MPTNQNHFERAYKHILGTDSDEWKWMDLAACKDMDPAIFFPHPHQSIQPAKKVCNQCPVRIQCLNFALNHQINYGVWGGISERERVRIRRRRARDRTI